MPPDARVGGVALILDDIRQAKARVGGIALLLDGILGEHVDAQAGGVALLLDAIEGEGVETQVGGLALLVEMILPAPKKIILDTPIGGSAYARRLSRAPIMGSGITPLPLPCAVPAGHLGGSFASAAMTGHSGALPRPAAVLSGGWGQSLHIDAPLTGYSGVIQPQAPVAGHTGVE
jgi:hypothetical protein